jgi:hypothetical protein
MIQTQGFASIQGVDSLADEINRWLVSNSQAMDTKFRLINIQYSSTSEGVPNSSELGRVNYSALVIYEFVEVKKTEDSTEPLDASGVE